MTSGVSAVNCFTTYNFWSSKVKVSNIYNKRKRHKNKKENNETKKYFLDPQTKKNFVPMHCEQLHRYDTTYF